MRRETARWQKLLFIPQVWGVSRACREALSQSEESRASHDCCVSTKESSEEEVECARETEQEAPEGTRRMPRSQNTNKIAMSSPRAQPESGSQADGDSESEMDQSEEPWVLPEKVGWKRSCKQAVRELDEIGDHMDDEARTPPGTKTPSSVCPPNKIRQQAVWPPRTFLRTVQKNQMLMTPTSAGRTSVIKSFIKHNTLHHVGAKVSVGAGGSQEGAFFAWRVPRSSTG
ncbi:inner centromere protein-like [Vombatus ursinus]|uniref:inner centromere protein-like n=1 Tax=Vombatus ursinus TaxID=29139 RepID=UPI000FFDB48D|nr:inner centromere protein-like [Vombatus ursinus]